MNQSSLGAIFRFLISNKKNTIYFLGLTLLSIGCSALESLEFIVIAAVIPGSGHLSHTLERLFQHLTIDAWFFAIVFLLFAARSALNYGRNLFQESWRFEFETQQKRRLLTELVSKPLSYIEGEEPAALAQRIDREAARLASIPDLVLRYGIRLPITVVQVLLVCWMISWKLILILAPMVLAFYLIKRRFKSQATQSHRKHLEKQAVEAAKISNFFQGFTILKAFGAEDAFLGHYFSLRDHARASYRTLLRENYFWAEMHGLMVATSLMIGVSYVFFYLGTGLKEVLLLMGSLKQLHEPLKNYQNQTHEIREAALLAAQPSSLPSVRRVLKSANSQIEVRSLSFGYGNAWRLKPISFQIFAGEKIALIGPNGAGKSTLLKLLAGFYDHYDGEIGFNGISTQSQIGYVIQRPFLFSGTIRDNIAFYQKFSHAEIEQAAWQACAGEFITGLPHQYDSFLHNDGAALSGGQRQKIHLARSFARKTPILLLDEATASLDLQSEQSILANCKEQRWQTQIVVSHRKEIVDWADRVIEIS